jgi:hypothetical protein
LTPASWTRVTAGALVAAVLAVVAALIRWHPELAYEISQENGGLELAQVALTAACALLALAAARACARVRRSFTLDAVIVAGMTIVVIGEIDLDRQLFGVKVIHTLFFVNSRVPLALRALAVIVVVGVPLAFGVWVLLRWRSLWHDASAALREAWGQVFASGFVIFALAELFERPLGRVAFVPRNSLEETLELVASVAFFIGALARWRAVRRAGR